MILVPESTRKFPLTQVPYLDLSVGDLFEHMLAIKRNSCPNWTDETASDPGVLLLWAFSVLSDFMVQHIERASSNTFIETVTDRESARRLLELIGYELSETQSSAVTLSLTHPSSHPQFTIYAGTQFSTADQAYGKVIFEVDSDTIVNADITSSTVDCTQGETTTDKILGSSDGSANQAFLMHIGNVAWHSESVEVNNGASWQAWTRVDHFVDSTSSSLHYKVEIRNEQDYYIVFGDGTNGQIPATEPSNVRATYVVSNGSLGNVPANTITVLVSDVNYIDSVTNAQAATGGLDQETIEHARIAGPASVKALDRIISIEDAEDIAITYSSASHGSIAVAKAISASSQIMVLYIVPASGGDPSDTMMADVQSWLGSKMVLGIDLEVKAPTYVPVDISANIYLHENFNSDEVSYNIRANLANYLSPVYNDPDTGTYPHQFGRNVRISDIYAVIDNTPGVDYLNLTLPTSDVTIDNNEIADIGTFTLTISSGTTTVSYHSTKTEILRENVERQFS